MIDHLLNSQLAPIINRSRRLRLWRVLTVCWSVGALAGLGLLFLQGQTGWAAPWAWEALAILALAGALALVWRNARSAPDYRAIAKQIERQHPELSGLLLTAVQQQSSPGEPPGYLQYRLLSEAVEQARQHDWLDTIPSARLAWVQAGHLAALCCFALVLSGMHVSVTKGAPALLSRAGVTVTPGDTALERGQSLVVMARFTGPLPVTAELVIGSSPEAGKRIPLVKSLADPVFGGSVMDAKNDFTYHIEYGARRTREFKVSVFEYPRLERADAQLQYPDYTGQPPKRIEDTRRLSAVEGSFLDLSLQLNKAVVSAKLVSRDKTRTQLPLQVETNRAGAALRHFPLAASKTWDLQLVDANGRTNKVPAQFVFDVLSNRPPELRLAAPRGDLRPSALEEISFTGTVWDDFGVKAYGLAYTLAGQNPKEIELGRLAPAREKRDFKYLLRLEDLQAQPDQLVSWHIWAEDLGPDGRVRRTSGDMFFGEVRPFEEIYREGQGGAENQAQSDQEQSEEQGQQGNQSARLAETQKQIIMATWKLQREHSTNATPPYRKDAEVVREAQAKALEQAESQQEKAANARAQALWNTATGEMQKALDQLNQATNSPVPLPRALAAEQSAYQALLKLQAREHEIARARSRNQRSSSSREQQMQRQLDQLELTQSENRYESQTQARTPQSAERREQLQVMNRLQELARRQQDLNDRLKEMQSALEEARNEQEREDVRRRLQRLQEEEQQMLADMDELRQRMERPENQSRLADERRQLDQARAEAQRAAEAARQGSVPQALTSGTRAQRQLQQLRDDMRKQNSSEFAEDVRQMRAEARELARRQEEIQKKVASMTNPLRKTLNDNPERQEVVDQLSQQKGRLTNLVERATQVSQQSETAEPLLSRQLYDTLRQFDQDDAGNVKQLQEDLLRRGLMTSTLYERLQKTLDKEKAKSLEAASAMVRQGYLPQASQAEERARTGIESLKRGVERAAERILGDDTEALRQARQELDILTEKVQREMAQAENGGSTNGQASANPTDRSPGAGESSTNRNRQVQSGQQASATSQTQRDRQNQPGQQASASPPNQRSPENGGNQNAGGGRDRQQPGSLSGRGQRNNANRPPSLASTNGPGNRLATEIDRVMDGGGYSGTGPILGEDFAPWSDRLREVEEMVDFPELRNDVAMARERARQIRLDYKRDLKKPDWAVVRLQVVKPLVEVRQRITEELARRESREALVPIDRDPVPGRYRELVRRYYEDLGKDK